MNYISKIVSIVKIIALLFIFKHESRGDEIVEKFYWTPKNNSQNIGWEFLVIGKRVPWSTAKVLCSPQHSMERSNDESLEPEDTLRYANSSTIRTNVNVTSPSRLAILEEDDMKIWLSRMLSESDYRYDGLWIGGHRTNSSSNWTWIGDSDNEKIPISSSSLLGNYPEWYKSKDHREVERNCLTFDKVGHDLPILVPSNCHLLKPFLCSRVVRKKNPDLIVEGIGIDVDGYRYTVYSVKEDGDEKEIANLENTSGVRKLNGGGLKWRDARVECRKRGQHLATVLSNEVATRIASIMLKNRPSMESVWLGGWSPDGTEWTWSPTGLVLSSEKSTTSHYPPWLAGHPASSSNLDEYYRRRGRCLVLDRHLCPYHISPVFLDLNCEKKRPFVCQDGLPGRPSFVNHDLPLNRSIAVGNRILEFSIDRMTWNAGREHCSKNFGRIASILDSTTLSAVLDKMTDLYLDHVWVGGRTEKTREGWRWFDLMGNALSLKGIGAGSSWCLGEDEDSWPKADADSCLNLDREGHGLPLFYGLQCDLAKQHVLCSIDHGSRSLPLTEDSDENKAEANSHNNDAEIVKLSSLLVARIGNLTSVEKSGMLYVLDDSQSVLNSWFAEQIKLITIIVRNLFPLSSEHPMGLLTFSQSSRRALAMNQTNHCSILSYLARQIIGNRETHRDPNVNNHDGVRGFMDLFKAADTAVDIVRNSGLPRVAIMLIADGQHTIANAQNEKEQDVVVKKLNSLRNSGHEAFAIFVGQGLRTSATDSKIRDLFDDSFDDKRNLYFVNSFSQLGELVSIINSTTSTAYNDSQCDEPHQIV